MSSDSSPALNPVKKFPSTPHGDALIIPVAAFLARVAPPLRHDLDAARVVNDLLCTSKRWPVIQNGRWRVFAQDPADLVKPLTKRYKGLENIVEAIHKVTGAVETPHLLHQCSQRAMGSADRGEHDLPDVCFSHGRRARQWTDVAAFGELHEKDSETALEENVMKVTASMHRCMQNDARRRFVYSFTINNSALRLWFCDRSQILVTEPFNFITEHRAVVHFFLSVMYASSSELGFDPTMALSEDGRHYDIKIRSKGLTQTCRTLKLLSSSRILLIGKGTRVWKAVRVDDRKEVGVPLVLKDTWTSPYLDSEGTVLKKLLSDLEQNHSQARSFFTSIEGYGDVYLNDECTILDYINTFKLADTTRALPVTCRADPMDKESAGQPRYIHHRIIYKDLCRSLHSETSVVQFFQHLGQITRALQTMHLAGWVHRDVSPANILVKDDGTALLADLEYAKRIGVGSEGKTGTPGFLALEAEVGRYRFPPPKNPPPQPSSSKYTLMERLRGMKDGKPIADEIAKPDLFYREEDGEDLPAVRYNPLHDLESVWWIAVYFVVTHEVHNADGAEGESFVAIMLVTASGANRTGARDGGEVVRCWCQAYDGANDQASSSDQAQDATG
ncbi:hypothetical protein NM688_g4376 [Phlebia brevispora]|uniref:Uncharacterized protein n=1 Tax=Phlebia brevispora TaxID=194682 RepID=A0ACC1T357_9APHY|nr:hypothetical protein NM688_g4376 [Phlebia brevispora]